MNLNHIVISLVVLLATKLNLSYIVISLVVLLAIKEITGTSSSKSAQLVARFLPVAIIPLLIIFVVIVSVEVAEILT